MKIVTVQILGENVKQDQKQDSNLVDFTFGLKILATPWPKFTTTLLKKCSTMI